MLILGCTLCAITTLKAQETIFIRRVCQDSINNKNNTIYWSFKQDSCKIVGTLTIWGRDGSLASPFEVVASGINPTNFEAVHGLLASSTWEYYIEATLNCGSNDKTFISKTVKVDNFNPSKTELDSVSVDVKNNSILLGWRRGLENDIFKYEVYYTPNIGTGYMIGSTIKSNYQDIGNRNPSLSKLTYQITAVDSCGNRPATGLPHSTIFLRGATDTCKRESVLNWENYMGWGTALKNEIYELRNDSFILIGQVPFDTTKFITKCNNTLTPCKYFIRTIKSTSPQISSSSNIFESTPIYRNLHPTPKINYVTTNPITGESTLSISTELNSENATLLIFNLNGKLIHSKKINIPTNINVGVINGVNEFMVTSFGECPTDSTSSAKSKNIYLTLDNNLLRWNPYFTWNRGVEKYIIYSFSGDYTPKEQDYIASGQTKDTFYTKFDAEGVNINCYYIEGLEKGGLERSKSNGICIGMNNEGIYWPNAINTTSTNNRLRVYGPGIIDNVPQKITVYNRWGEEVFHSGGDDFTGMGNNGVELGAGVYLFKALITQFNETKEIKGTISILR